MGRLPAPDRHSRIFRGGHLASTAGTHFDAGKPDAEDPVERVGSRPDRLILVYPVIALATPYGHSGSKKNLLGDKPSDELVRSLSNETQVTALTPPTFLAHTNEDTGVPAENSLLFVMALRAAKVPVEFHLIRERPARARAGPRRKAVRDRSQPGVPGMAQALRDLAQGPGFPRPRWRSCVSGRTMIGLSQAFNLGTEPGRWVKRKKPARESVPYDYLSLSRTAPINWPVS
jgi:hypothetical protein